jgi:3-oxoacyl-[acyl-carrier protein] reductase
MSKFANKVALVTGGFRGIGSAIAKRLAADGVSVAITYAFHPTRVDAIEVIAQERSVESTQEFM